jgi:hypothetical protein
VPRAKYRTSTSPKFIRTLLALDGIRVGDQVRVGGSYVDPRTGRSEPMHRRMLNRWLSVTELDPGCPMDLPYYVAEEGGAYIQPHQIKAWRRKLLTDKQEA